MASATLTSPSDFPRLPSYFTPIPEYMEEEDDDQEDTTETTKPNKRHPTPPHSSASPATASTVESTTPRSTPGEEKATTTFDNAVNLGKRRPSSVGKIKSIVPVVDTSSGSPNKSSGGVKALFSTLTCKNLQVISSVTPSPRQSSSRRSTSNSTSHEGEWKLAVVELSRKLHQTTKKHDEAVLEAAKLKQSLAEMETKVTKLESHCEELRLAALQSQVTRSGRYTLHHYANKNGARGGKGAGGGFVVDPSFPVDDFLKAVTESRSAVRHLARSLAIQIRQTRDSKLLQRIALLLQPFGMDPPSSTKSLLLYVEALLNYVFYQDFESAGFTRSGREPVLDPFLRCHSNLSTYQALKALSWEEVLKKGTKSYSEELSGFCDRKMGEIVGLFTWTQAWLEPMLCAFFGAAKWVWLVHLLTRSVHPALPLFRVGKDDQFDSRYMEDVAVEKVQQGEARSVTSRIQMMVAPGFYVYDSVIKCKVICIYNIKNDHVTY